MDSAVPKTKIKFPIALKWAVPENRLKEIKEKSGQQIYTDLIDVLNISKVLSISNVWYDITIYPNDDDYPGETWIYVFLYYDDEEMAFEADFNISVESANYSFSIKHVFSSDSEYARVKCCKTEELYDPENRFIVDGKMTVKLDGFLMVEKDADVQMGRDVTCTYAFDDSLGLSLWNQEEDKNITVCADGEEITVHKCVLTARSSVFLKMLNSGMKEEKESKVTIEDFSFDIVEKAVKLCYHQSLVPHSTLDDKILLLQFFDKYDIQPLKDDLETYLISIINELTVCRLTNAALVSNSRKLEMKCTEFLRDCYRTKPIADFDLLDKDFALNFLKNAFCQEIL